MICLFLAYTSAAEHCWEKSHHVPMNLHFARLSPTSVALLSLHCQLLLANQNSKCQTLFYQQSPLRGPSHRLQKNRH